MKRLGYAKLADYGLVLTPENRVLATRPTVLDDGFGGRIVGWEEGDLANMELDKWAPKALPVASQTIVKPAPVAAVAPRVASPPPVPARVTGQTPVVSPAALAAGSGPVVAPSGTFIGPAVARPLPGVASYVPAIPVAPVAPITPMLAKPAPIAPIAASPFDDEQNEDDWEWTIAVARARASAEEAEQAAAQVANVIPITRASKPKFAAAKTIQGVAIVAPPSAKVVPIIKQDFLSKAQLDDDAAEWAAIRTAAEAQAMPKTIIPVPTLSRVSPSAVAPVVRSRIARGTDSPPAKQAVAIPSVKRHATQV